MKTFLNDIQESVPFIVSLNDVVLVPIVLTIATLSKQSSAKAIVPRVYFDLRVFKEFLEFPNLLSLKYRLLGEAVVMSDLFVAVA